MFSSHLNVSRRATASIIRVVRAQISQGKHLLRAPMTTSPPHPHPPLFPSPRSTNIMSAQGQQSSRERIQNAANTLFAHITPNFASSSSRFDITSTVALGGIQARLIQWHRVGQVSLRCVIVFHGPAKPSYREAVDAMADELDRLVTQQSQQDQQQQTPCRLPPLPWHGTQITLTSASS